VEALTARIQANRELNKRLFWLKNISDECLEKLYSISTCLIAASEGEGFGLPLIEAAQHGLPIIARDIPVFREVAKDGAFFFSGLNPENLADAIEQWIDLYNSDRHPKSETIHWITWEQSVQRLAHILTAS
jgi:glycosyltransferase involved in cell wall biosynthesis